MRLLLTIAARASSDDARTITVVRHLVAKCLNANQLHRIIDPVKLPNVERATVSREKVTNYLLSLTHRDGRSKAKFCARFDFSASDWQLLAAAFIRHAHEYEVAGVEESPFGKRYIIEGTLPAPDGRVPAIRSVWFIANGDDVPRFATAYPLKRRDR